MVIDSMMAATRFDNIDFPLQVVDAVLPLG